MDKSDLFTLKLFETFVSIFDCKVFLNIQDNDFATFTEEDFILVWISRVSLIVKSKALKSDIVLAGNYKENRYRLGGSFNLWLLKGEF